MKPTIRFIISTTVAKRDIYGNCYNFSQVTSTLTGRSVTINSGWGSDGSNVRALLRSQGLEWSQLYYCERVIGKRDYKRELALRTCAIHETEVTADTFFDLEREEAKV